MSLGGHGRRAAGVVARRVLPRGRGRVAQLLHHHPGGGDIPFRDAFGYRRLADLRDLMEARLFAGCREIPDAVAGLVGPGDWAIDVGASVGAVSGQLCARVDASGCVWAVEPVPRNVDRLEQLRDMNGLAQLRVFPLALSSHSGSAMLSLPEDAASGYASFTASWLEGEHVEVATRPLDDLVEEDRPAGRLGLIKLDVEGHEAAVLEGARRTLSAFAPPLYCEFNDVVLRDSGSSASELLAHLQGLGYRVAPGWEAEASALAGKVVNLLLLHG